MAPRMSDVVMVYERIDGGVWLITDGDEYAALPGVTLAHVMPVAERMGIPVISHREDRGDIVQTRIA